MENLEPKAPSRTGKPKCLIRPHLLLVIPISLSARFTYTAAGILSLPLLEKLLVGFIPGVVIGRLVLCYQVACLLWHPWLYPGFQANREPPQRNRGGLIRWGLTDQALSNLDFFSDEGLVARCVAISL
jgi:hypothetical protein